MGQVVTAGPHAQERSAETTLSTTEDHMSSLYPLLPDSDEDLELLEAQVTSHGVSSAQQQFPTQDGEDSRVR